MCICIWESRWLVPTWSRYYYHCSISNHHHTVFCCCSSELYFCISLIASRKKSINMAACISTCFRILTVVNCCSRASQCRLVIVFRPFEHKCFLTMAMDHKIGSLGASWILDSLSLVLVKQWINQWMNIWSKTCHFKVLALLGGPEATKTKN